MAADFYAPQFQQPNMLGAYLRGQMGALQIAGAQQGLQQGQQQLQAGQLNIDQLRLMLQKQQLINQGAQRLMGGQQGGSPAGQPVTSGAPIPQTGTAGAGASNPVSASGGIQNGPQASVVGPYSPMTAPTQPSGSFDGSVGGGDPSFGAGGGLSQGSMMALGLLAPEAVRGMMAGQQAAVKTAQLQAQGPLDFIDSVFNSASPARTVMANPQLMARWMPMAQQLGLDPVKDFNDQNVRAALAMAGNRLRGQVGLPAKDYPVPVIGGAYGSQYSAVTGQRVTPPVMPGYSIEKTTDTTGRVTGQVVVTKPGLGASPGVGTTAGPQIDLGHAPMNEENIKMAGFAAISGGALDKIRSLESSGVSLNPRQRTALLDAVTDDSQGITGGIHKLMSQEYLTNLPPNQQTYITAIMPFLQGTAHLMAGMRLPPSTIRADLESVVPLDLNNKDAMGMVNTTRSAYLNAMDVGAGSAGSAPEFASTIGARRAAAAKAQANGPQMPTLADIQAEIARRKAGR